METIELEILKRAGFISYYGGVFKTAEMLKREREELKNERNRKYGI